MKRLWMTAAVVCLSMMSAHALIVSVDEHGDIPAQGMEITISESKIDSLSGKAQMGMKGGLIAETPLTITISRSAAGIEDEFCCAGQCTSGNKQASETLHFNPGGMADWYSHYIPAPGSRETIVYTFTEGSESLVLTVHYDYATQGVEKVQSDQVPSTKIIQDGILYIIKDNKKYTLL